MTDYEAIAHHLIECPECGELRRYMPVSKLADLPVLITKYDDPFPQHMVDHFIREVTDDPRCYVVFCYHCRGSVALLQDIEQAPRKLVKIMAKLARRRV